MDSKHEFRLTQEPLRLGEAEKFQFVEIGRASYGILRATGEFYRRILRGERTFPREINDYLSRALEAGLTKRQRRLQRIDPTALPIFFRVDCLAVAGENSVLKIMTNEIEGERPVGLGFGLFTQTLRQEIYQNKDPGLAEAMVENLSEFRNGESVAHILAEDQLFYLPEQELFCQKMRQMGIPIFLIREKDLQLRHGKVVLPDGTLTNKIFYLPLFNPEKSKKAPEEELLAYLYERREVEFFISPNGFLGTKAVYGLIHHPFLKEFYEAYLEDLGFKISAIKDYFPYSCLITGSNFERERLLLEMGRTPEPPVMIKAVGLSASRRFAFPGERAEAKGLLEDARRKPFEYLIQEFKPQAEFEVTIVENDRVMKERQFFRLAAFYMVLSGEVRLVEVVGTGLGSPLATSERPAVHGNPACTMFPVVFK